MNTTLSPHEPQPNPERGVSRWIPALLLGILLGVAGLSLISRQSDSPWWSRWFGGLVGRSTRVDVSQPTVVNKIQQLQRLETVVYTMDKVVTGEKRMRSYRTSWLGTGCSCWCMARWSPALTSAG